MTYSLPWWKVFKFHSVPVFAFWNIVWIRAPLLHSPKLLVLVVHISTYNIVSHTQIYSLYTLVLFNNRLILWHTAWYISDSSRLFLKSWAKYGHVFCYVTEFNRKNLRNMWRNITSKSFVTEIFFTNILDFSFFVVLKSISLVRVFLIPDCLTIRPEIRIFLFYDQLENFF